MAKDFAFMFYPGDYLRDTQCLSEPVQVAYDRIMCEHMRHICITQDQLNFFTKRLTDDQKSELMMVMEKVSGGFQISWVAESINKRKAYSESRSKNRASKPKPEPANTSKSYDPHMEDENENKYEDQKEDQNETLVWPTFEDFWILYEKKVGDRKKLEVKWNKLSQRDKEAVMNHIPIYKLAQPDKKFRKNPETYLNNKSWLDEIIGSKLPNEESHDRIKELLGRITKKTNEPAN